jgi:hypothetical protein
MFREGWTMGTVDQPRWDLLDENLYPPAQMSGCLGEIDDCLGVAERDHASNK